MAETSRPIHKSRVARIRIQWEKVVGFFAAIVILYLIGVPMGMLVFSSLRDTREKLPIEPTDFTFQNYVQVFTSEMTYRLFRDTLVFALGSLCVGFVLAMLFAWFLERAKTPARSLLMLMVLMPLGTPPVCDAMGWALLASPSTGVLNKAIFQPLLGMTGQGPLNIYTIAGMIFVAGMKLVPLVYIMISGPIARFDPSLEEASLTSRVSVSATFRHITFPLLRPAMLAAAIYCLIITLESFDIPAVLGMPYRLFVFSTLIFDATHPALGLPNYGLTAAYATVFLAIAGVLIWVYVRATHHKEEFSVITGKAYRAKLFDFGRWTWFFVALIVVYFVLAVVLPFAVLVWTSLGLIYRPIHIDSLVFANLNAYAEFVESPRVSGAVLNTAIIAVTSATGALLLASISSWLSVRSGFRGASIPDRITILMIGVPSIVLAMSMIFFYVWVPLPIYGSIWIIAIAVSTRQLAYCTRLMEAAYLQIHKELEEASLVSGVPWIPTVIRIVVPIIWPSFARGWFYVFSYALRDMSIAVMLFTVHNDTIGVRLWITWFTDGNAGKASAIAVGLALVSMVFNFVFVRATMVHQTKEVF